MSGDLGRDANGIGHGGPARGYKWADAEPGNLLAAKSGFWIDPTRRDEHRAELEAIVGVLVEHLPYDPEPFALAIDQLALRLWRQRRAYADLDERGLLRGGKPAPILDHLARLENAIMRDLEALGLTPRSAQEMIERTRDPFAALAGHLAELRAEKSADAD